MTDTIELWTEQLAKLRERFDGRPDQLKLVDAWQNVTAGSVRKGTMREWMTAHHGELVDTLQMSRDDDHGWNPCARQVDAKTRASAVLLDGSIRDYKGVRVLGVTTDALVVANAHHVIAYRVSIPS